MGGRRVTGHPRGVPGGRPPGLAQPRGVPGGRPPGPAQPAVVAVDGGNSKTDLALVAADGTLLASVRGPGMPAHLSEANVKIIADLLRSAIKALSSTTGSSTTGSSTT